MSGKSKIMKIKTIPFSVHMSGLIHFDQSKRLFAQPVKTPITLLKEGIFKHMRGLKVCILSKVIIRVIHILLISCIHAIMQGFCQKVV